MTPEAESKCDANAVDNMRMDGSVGKCAHIKEWRAFSPSLSTPPAAALSRTWEETGNVDKNLTQADPAKRGLWSRVSVRCLA